MPIISENAFEDADEAEGFGSDETTFCTVGFYNSLLWFTIVKSLKILEKPSAW